jgi:peptidoglycan/LPS O-acetylase OafA/YrhL
VQQTDERRGGFRADIQGLRAVAVGAVLAYHAGLPFVPGGFAGVDVFFVISGFLITGHLLRERELKGSISLVGFYARRVRRILPAALVVAVLTLVVATVVLPATRLAEIARDGLASVLFVPNVWFGVKADDYLAGDASSPFLHYWSLGVEEQFYLIWPALILALLAVRRRSVLVVGLWIVFAASFAVCLVSMTWSPGVGVRGRRARRRVPRAFRVGRRSPRGPTAPGVGGCRRRLGRTRRDRRVSIRPGRGVGVPRTLGDRSRGRHGARHRGTPIR